MKKIIFALALGVMLAACTSKPIANVTNESVPTAVNGKKLSIDTVQQAILVATRKRGWSSRLVKPGLIEASLLAREHKAVVEIPFTDTQYSINYKSSENLNADGGSIHRKYNLWVSKLSQDIQRELGVNSQRY